MPNTLQKLFTTHPASVDETYVEHALFAFAFALKLFQASCAAMVHAVIPGLCEKTASTIVQELAARTQNRGREAAPADTTVETITEQG